MNILFPNVLPFFAKSFEHYLTLERLDPVRKYSYAKRDMYNLPVIDVTIHRPKCKLGEPWMYIAVPPQADFAMLRADQRLYVGAQTQDRMFRGDGLDGNNFHHGEMRAGNGKDNLVSYLQSGSFVDIYRIEAGSIIKTIRSSTDLECLLPLIQQPKNPRKHIGYWLEQCILYKEPAQWRWNTAPADKVIGGILGII